MPSPRSPRIRPASLCRKSTPQTGHRVRARRLETRARTRAPRAPHRIASPLVANLDAALSGRASQSVAERAGKRLCRWCSWGSAKSPGIVTATVCFLGAGKFHSDYSPPRAVGVSLALQPRGSVNFRECAGERSIAPPVDARPAVMAGKPADNGRSSSSSSSPWWKRAVSRVSGERSSLETLTRESDAEEGAQREPPQRSSS
eukprot:ctg_5868.g661